MSAKMRPNGRSKNGAFISIPNSCLVSPNFASLSYKACKLFLDMAAQFRGYNNGDLCMSWSLMQERGWRSQDTLNRARKELVDKGWLIQTRQGGRNQCSLYAFSFYGIADMSKLDVAPTRIATNDWMKWKPD